MSCADKACRSLQCFRFSGLSSSLPQSGGDSKGQTSTLVGLVPDSFEFCSLEPVDKSGGRVAFSESPAPKDAGPPERMLRRVPPESVLGKGTFGVVWRARDLNSGQVLAVKSVKLTESTKITLRECEIAELIRNQPHPCIVRIRSVHHFKEACLYTLVMDVCSGGTLTQRVARQRARAAHAESAQSKLYKAPPDALRWLIQVFLGLEHLHLECEVLLRDLKPDNVLLDDRNNAKIIDFGLGKDAKHGLDWTFGYPTGTPGYIAPELLKREPHDFKADLFSFGVLVWLVFTGGIESEVTPQPPTGHTPDKPNNFQALEDDWQRLARRAHSDSFGVRGAIVDDARDFVIKLIKRDHSERLNHDEIRAHPLFLPEELPPQKDGPAAVELWLSRGRQ